MKTSILLCLLAFCFGSTQAQGKILVRITNFRSNKGICLIGLYNNAASFGGKGEPVRYQHATIANNVVEAWFENVPAGTYAISVIHDANGNKKFDKNFIGIPSEGYGASGNKLPFAAAPKFDANKFLVNANATTAINIRLRYLF
jgi:uncharacterized protein (DUF2141 family)